MLMEGVVAIRILPGQMNDEVLKLLPRQLTSKLDTVMSHGLYLQWTKSLVAIISITEKIGKVPQCYWTKPMKDGTF